MDAENQEPKVEAQAEMVKPDKTETLPDMKATFDNKTTCESHYKNTENREEKCVERDGKWVAEGKSGEVVTTESEGGRRRRRRKSRKSRRKSRKSRRKSRKSRRKSRKSKKTKRRRRRRRRK